MIYNCFVLSFCVLIGAKRAREIILSVLSSACDDGDLTIPEAMEAVEDIFKQNASHLYDIHRVRVSLDLKKASSSNLSSIKSIPPPEDIVFVRILWVDTSGQHRCRVSSFALASMMGVIVMVMFIIAIVIVSLFNI